MWCRAIPQKFVRRGRGSHRWSFRCGLSGQMCLQIALPSLPKGDPCDGPSNLHRRSGIRPFGLLLVLRMPSPADLGQVFLGNGSCGSGRHLAGVANGNPIDEARLPPCLRSPWTVRKASPFCQAFAQLHLRPIQSTTTGGPNNRTNCLNLLHCPSISNLRWPLPRPLNRVPIAQTICDAPSSRLHELPRVVGAVRIQNRSNYQV